MLVILTGAIKNLGDYLIGERARQLIRHFTDEEIVEFSRFEPLDDKLEVINRSKAVILCGGPAYASDMYPGIYPLCSPIDKIKVPIIPFGLGWSGHPFQEPEKFEFTQESFGLLDKIHQQISYSCCRDVITHSILKRQGWDNVIMTGCPAWYDLEFMNQPFRIKKDIKKIVLTTPANRTLGNQFIKVLEMTQRQFPEATIYVSFHRGILLGKKMTPRKSLSYTIVAAKSLLRKAKVVDVSGDLKKIDFYADCDLHIGYRVHGHLYFLAKRLPSILINEDGRGLGMVTSMDLPILNHNDPEMLTKLDAQVSHYKNTEFKDFQKVETFLDGHIGEMERFFKSLPI